MSSFICWIPLSLSVLFSSITPGSSYAVIGSRGAYHSLYLNDEYGTLLEELPSGYYITDINSFKADHKYLNYGDPPIESGYLTQYSIGTSIQHTYDEKYNGLKRTFRFQLWAATEEEGVFSFQGENVIPFYYPGVNNKQDYNVEYLPRNLYINDTDTLMVKSDYYIGYYVRNNKPDINTYTYSFYNTTWQHLSSNPVTFSTIGEKVNFQQYGDGSESLGFEYEVYVNRADLSCEQKTLDSLNGEGFIDIHPKVEITDSKCWVVKMDRPCASSDKDSLSLTFEMVEPKGCQDIYNFKFYRGGKKASSDYDIIDMVCRQYRMKWSCSGTVCYFEYNLDEGHHLDFVRLRYFVDPNDVYYREDLELCEGEYLPSETNYIYTKYVRRVLGGAISGIVLVIIIAVIVVAVKCNKKKPATDAPNDPQEENNLAPLVITENEEPQTEQNDQPPPYNEVNP